MKKAIIFLIIVLFTSFAYAESEMPYKIGETAYLHIPCFIEGKVCELCNASITIDYPNSTTAVNNESMTFDMTYFTYAFNKTNESGLYNAVFLCTNGSLSSFDVFQFQVSSKGNKIFDASIQDTIFYVIAMIIIFTLFIVCMIYAVSIDGATKFSMGPEGNYIVEVNIGGYIKLGLFCLSYLFFWILTFILWNLAQSFYFLINISGILKTLFTITSILIIPLFIIIGTIGIMKAMTDSDLVNMAKRGLKPR